MAVSHLLAELSETYARERRKPVSVVSTGGVDAARRVHDGEAFDFVVLAADAIDRLAEAGRIDARSRTELVRSEVAVAVAAGAPRPDAITESALRDAVAHARAIGYSTGPSGSHLVHLLARWDIAGASAPRLVQAPPGVPVASLIARGDVELGFQQLSELVHAPGIDVVGPLPPEIALATVFCGAVCTASKAPASGAAFLAYAASAAADDARRRHGMRPPCAGR